MASKPLDVLKRGLKALQTQFKTKKLDLETWLAEKQSISSQEERWLDGEANLVDELQVVEALENASDYERGLERLDHTQKGVVSRLRQAAGDVMKAVGKKRKRTFLVDSLCSQ
jgi:hypothetical protein